MKRICSQCHKRPARYKYKGRYSKDVDHDLCLQCYRNIKESSYQNQKAEREK
jgi:protein-arginine kinase activator protein McsA